MAGVHPGRELALTHPRAARWIAGEVLRILGDLVPGRIQQREESAPGPRHSGCSLEEPGERIQPRTMFFDGIGAVDAQHAAARDGRRAAAASAACTARGRRQARRTRRRRPRSGTPGRATSRGRRAAHVGDGAVDHVSRQGLAKGTRAPSASMWKPTTSAGRAGRRADRRRACGRQHAPGAAARPGDVHEVREPRPAARGPQHPRRRGTAGSRAAARGARARASRLLGHGLGECRVDAPVRVPGRPGAAIDRPARVRRARARAARTTAAGSRTRCSSGRSRPGRARAAAAGTGSRCGRAPRTTRVLARDLAVALGRTALATHVTSWLATSPESAVTSPPPPRRAVREPSLAGRRRSGPGSRRRSAGGGRCLHRSGARRGTRRRAASGMDRAGGFEAVGHRTADGSEPRVRRADPPAPARAHGAPLALQTSGSVALRVPSTIDFERRVPVPPLDRDAIARALRGHRSLEILERAHGLARERDDHVAVRVHRPAVDRRISLPGVIPALAAALRGSTNLTWVPEVAGSCRAAAMSEVRVLPPTPSQA